MKKEYFFTIVAIPFAMTFWLFDSLIHYFVYNEFEFELIPSEINELWMRCIIFFLLIIFGVFADYHTNKIINKDLEKLDVYITMLAATKHILNNFLQGMRLFRDLAGNSKDIDKEILKLFDESIDNAVKQIKDFEEIENPNKENIEDKFMPK